MAIIVYKGLTRNPEIENTSVLGFPNICRLGQVRDTKFRKNVCNKKLISAAKCQIYSFMRLEIIKGKTTGGEGNYPPLTSYLSPPNPPPPNPPHTLTHTHTLNRQKMDSCSFNYVLQQNLNWILH